MRQIWTEFESLTRRICVFWLVWKHMSIRLGNCGTKLGHRKLGGQRWEQSGQRMQELGALGDEEGRREWVLCELLAGHR